MPIFLWSHYFEKVERDCRKCIFLSKKCLVCRKRDRTTFWRERMEWQMSQNISRKNENSLDYCVQLRTAIWTCLNYHHLHHSAMFKHFSRLFILKKFVIAVLEHSVWISIRFYVRIQLILSQMKRHRHFVRTSTHASVTAIHVSIQKKMVKNRLKYCLTLVIYRFRWI